MSVIKFELTKEHIALVKNIDFEETLLSATGEYVFGLSGDKYEDVGIIVYGIPDTEFDPTSSDAITYSDEQKEEMDKLISEIPHALQIMLTTGIFSEGRYKTKFHDINWKKIG